MDITPILKMKKLRPDMLNNFPRVRYDKKLAELGFEPRPI